MNNKFKFDLQKVLEYKEQLEEESKNAYLEVRSRRLFAEGELHKIHERKELLVSIEYSTLEDRKAQDAYLQRLNDEERSQKAVVSILISEEENAHKMLLERKKETGALQKLQERQFKAWMHEMARKEQNSLDEWVTTQRY